MKLITDRPDLPKLPPAPRAEATPSTDKVLREVREARASDAARGSGPRKPYNNSMATSPATPEPDLHSALMSVGEQMMQYHDKPASLATVGHALKQVALKIKPPEIGADTSGLFSTPGPERV
jgi:hypothetical protein